MQAILNMRQIVAIFALVLCAGAVNARHARGGPSPPTLLMPAVNNVSTNWANAGLAVIGGIPTRNTQCGSTVSPTGASPGDATAINTAISACTAGDFVQLGAGTTVSITASISNNTLTCSPTCSGVQVGMVLFDGTGPIAQYVPGVTVTAVVSAGTTYTVSYSSWNGTVHAVPSEAMTAVLAFQIDQRSEFIQINKSITLRGSGSYQSGGYWPTVLNFYNGSIPNWAISLSSSNAQCGATSASTSGCNPSNPLIQMGANTTFSFGWSGLSTGGGGSTSGVGTTLAADVAQGATTIQVANTASFVVGAWFLIAENPALGSTTNPVAGGQAAIQASSDWTSTSPSPATGRIANPDTGSAGWTYSLAPNLVTQELKLITAIGAGPCPGTGCTITFDSPLTTAFRQSGSHNAQAFWPTALSTTYTPFIQQVGLENLEITRGVNAVSIQYCAYCWVRNVEAAGYVAGAFNFRWAARSQLTGIYVHHAFNDENNGNEYPIAVDAGSTEILLENNISRLSGKGMVSRAAGGGNVVAYSYFDNTMYMQQNIGDEWVDMSANASHYAGSHHFLFEGNWTNACDGDETHGSNGYQVFFRNWCTGFRTNFTDMSNTSLSVSDVSGIGWCGNTGSCGAGNPNPPNPLRAGGPMAFNYWYAFVGNVMGTSGQSISANGWNYICTARASDRCIWMSGWTGGEWGNNFDSNLDGVTATYQFRSGNYDYFHSSIFDWAGGYSQTLPNSLYAASKPSYFTGATCTYSWPWITSQSSPFVNPNSCSGSGNPAQARYNAGTPFTQP